MTMANPSESRSGHGSFPELQLIERSEGGPSGAGRPASPRGSVMSSSEQTQTRRNGDSVSLLTSFAAATTQHKASATGPMPTPLVSRAATAVGPTKPSTKPLDPSLLMPLRAERLQGAPLPHSSVAGPRATGTMTQMIRQKRETIGEQLRGVNHQPMVGEAPGDDRTRHGRPSYHPHPGEGMPVYSPRGGNGGPNHPHASADARALGYAAGAAGFAALPATAVPYHGLSYWARLGILSLLAFLFAMVCLLVTRPGFIYAHDDDTDIEVYDISTWRVLWIAATVPLTAVSLGALAFVAIKHP